MDMATSMQSGKVREIFDWDLTVSVCVYSDWHEELGTLQRYSCQ